jgi:hypothetical protein
VDILSVVPKTAAAHTNGCHWHLFHAYCPKQNSLVVVAVSHFWQ